MKQLTFKQSAFAYLLGTACISAFLLPAAVSNHAATAAAAVPLLSEGICAAFAAILFTVNKKYGSLKQCMRARLGQRGERVFRACLCLFMLFTALFYACAFYDRLASTAFSYLPRTVCIAAVVLCAALFSGAREQSIGRTVQVVFLLMLLSLTAFVLFSAGAADVKGLLPVKVKSFTLFLRAFLFPVGTAGLFAALTYDNESHVPKLSSLQAVFLAGNALMSLMIFLTQAVFGSVFSQRVAYPFFALVKSADSLSGFEHFESLLSGVWIVMSVCFFTVLLKTGSDLFCSLVRGNAHTKALWALLPAGAVLAAALCVPDNRFLNEFVLSTAVPLGNVILLMIIPAILTLTIVNN